MNKKYLSDMHTAQRIPAHTPVYWYANKHAPSISLKYNQNYAD